MSEGEKRQFGIKPLWLAIAATVIVLGAASGYFALQKSNIDSTGRSSSGAQSADAEPSPTGTCGKALARVRDYGVVPFNSALSGDEDGRRNENGRVECAVSSGDQTYSMVVNVSCDNPSDPKCLEIYRVTEGNGNSLFQKRPYSF